MLGLQIIFVCFFLASSLFDCSMATEMDMNELKSYVENIEKEITKKQEDMLKLLEDQGKKMEKFAKDYANLRDIFVVVMENKTAEVAKVIEDAYEKQSRSKVAFSATAGYVNTVVTQKQTIILTSVLTNTGNAYNQTSGEFVAPITGTYYFFCSMMSSHGAEFWGHMTVNGIRRASVNERGTDTRHGMGSQAIVTNLNVGDTVALKTGQQLYGKDYTTFSGFLLN